MLHIAIVEDQQNDSEVLKQYLARYASETGTEIKTTCFENAVVFLTNYSAVYNIVMLDIQMPHMDGMDAAAKLRELDPSVPLVFITNMSNYAVRGYAVDAVDFVVKPVRYAVFFSMMQKLQRIVARGQETITLKTPENFVRVALDSIAYIEVENHKVRYHTESGDFLVWSSLTQEEKKLPHDRFAKPNNYCIVNFKFVKAITGSDVIVQGERIAMSRPRKKSFTDAFLAYCGKYV